ncbi:MAG: GreA/GreB family elongation factor [Thermomicrobiales bacterium]
MARKRNTRSSARLRRSLPKGKISNESPIGKALLGRKKGDVVDIRTPTTVLQARVVSVNGSK